MMQRLGVRSPILLIGGICVTLMLDFHLSIVLICLLPFTAILIYIISKNGIPLYTNLQNSVDSMIRTVREDISGVKVIKALSKTDYEKSRFSAVNSDVVSRERKAGIIMSVTNPMMSLFLNVGLTLVILMGAYRVDAGLTQPGKIIAFLTYFTIILNAMLMITRLFVVYSKGVASAKRIQDVLDAPDILRLKPSNRNSSKYHISFDKVCFSYHKGKTNLKDCSFNIEKGKTLGIIGSTGSGKSTIINLLMRLYDVESGEIRISGMDIRSIPLSQLHSKFGVVIQNDILFADTIESNIDFGRNLCHEQIEAAAESAQAAEFIDSLPDGYMHMLSQKSTNLSGGQKQRIMIARALAANPEILVLDDSSSALDYKTDAMLRKALKENFSETTTIIIAQRISSIINADNILVMEDGKISGLGKHDELLASCETYREIYVSQTGGGKIA
jgi:ATP-binding cassette subfamily B protein